MSTDPLTALNNEYGAEWNVRRPGRYVADHRQLDVTIISDSVPELAEKLRAFTELIKGLPLPVPLNRLRIPYGRFPTVADLAGLGTLAA